MTNPSKILRLSWDKQNDTFELAMRRFTEEEPVTKKSILIPLGSMYDVLGMLSSITVEGKQIGKKRWTTEISDPLKKWWTLLRTIVGNMTKAYAVLLHVFADASNLACCAAAIAVVEHSLAVVKGLLTSKSRILKRRNFNSKIRVNQ